MDTSSSSSSSSTSYLSTLETWSSFYADLSDAQWLSHMEILCLSAAKKSMTIFPAMNAPITAFDAYYATLSSGDILFLQRKLISLRRERQQTTAAGAAVGTDFASTVASWSQKVITAANSTDESAAAASVAPPAEERRQWCSERQKFYFPVCAQKDHGCRNYCADDDAEDEEAPVHDNCIYAYFDKTLFCNYKDVLTNIYNDLVLRGLSEHDDFVRLLPWVATSRDSLIKAWLDNSKKQSNRKPPALCKSVFVAYEKGYARIEFENHARATAGQALLEFRGTNTNFARVLNGY